MDNLIQTNRSLPNANPTLNLALPHTSLSQIKPQSQSRSLTPISYSILPKLALSYSPLLSLPLPCITCSPLLHHQALQHRDMRGGLAPSLPDRHIVSALTVTSPNPSPQSSQGQTQGIGQGLGQGSGSTEQTNGGDATDVVTLTSLLTLAPVQVTPLSSSSSSSSSCQSHQIHI